MDSSRTIGKRLQKTRLALGLTKVEFRRKASIAQSTYAQYEGGNRTPELPFAVALADAHGLTLDWIYRGVLAPMNLKLRRRLQP